MGEATPYSDAELAELRALHEGLCDDTDCTSQRLYATIDSLRAILATERAEGERLRVLRDNAMNLLECGFPGMGRWTAAQRKLYESIVTVAPWPDCPCSPGDGTTRCLFETACQDKAAALSARPSPTEEA